jgi:hypothetical protein
LYSDEYYTKKCLFDRVHELNRFELDPASCAKAYKGIPYYTKEQNGLRQNWEGRRIFCNPPFSQLKEFLEKTVTEVTAPSVLLIPVRTETAYWERLVWTKADSILFLKKRNHFEPAFSNKSSPTFASCLVAYKGGCLEGLDDLGELVVLKKGDELLNLVNAEFIELLSKF